MPPTETPTAPKTTQSKHVLDSSITPKFSFPIAICVEKPTREGESADGTKWKSHRVKLQTMGHTFSPRVDEEMQDLFTEGSVYEVKGSIDTYKEIPQFKIEEVTEK